MTRGKSNADSLFLWFVRFVGFSHNPIAAITRLPESFALVTGELTVAR